MFISPVSKQGINAITEIDCGTSSPKLAGSIDISSFTNLNSFRCFDNDITTFTGNTLCPQLTILALGRNKLTSFPSFTNMPILQELRLDNNLLTGSIPSLDSLTGLLDVRLQENVGITGNIPSLSALTNLESFYCIRCNLTGPIPPLTNNINLKDFRCDSQVASPKLNGPIPDFINNNQLQYFYCHNNQLSGSIPNLTNTSLYDFRCYDNKLNGYISNFPSTIIIASVHTNQLSGSIPNLNGCPSLNTFHCFSNNLTGSIPILTSNVNLVDFRCHTNFLSGSIPNLSTCTQLSVFECDTQYGATKITNFAGGSVSNTLGTFKANNNQLTSTAVDNILATFVTANRTTGTKVLNLGGTGNSSPSYTGGVTTTSPGSNFTRSGTLVTANVTGHGHTTGDIVTITGITPTVFQGTFVVSVNNLNQFQYTTISSGTSTGTGTATMRRTTNPSDGYASYQNLALVSRTGGPWDITINQP